MEEYSLIVWDKLNMFIGSRQLVVCRQKFWQLHDIVTNNTFRKKILSVASGSVAEGLSLHGSDIDTMCVDKGITVKTKHRGGTPDAELIMDTVGVKPGFTKLYMGLGDRKVQMQKIDTFATALIRVNDRLYLSSLAFRDEYIHYFKRTVHHAVAHGPCATFKHGDQDKVLEFDIMLCFSGTVWPPEAEEWLQRRRINNWPCRELVSNIVKDGFLVVPIGNPKSVEGHMEWRISFSLAEKKLVHSMNHVQIVCYGLLKLYLKHVIELREDCKGLLCSYFMKTSLFFCMEDESLVWDKHNLLKCFWACFKRLFLWVREGYCPNYFITTNNMFEGKIYGENQVKLKEHLFNLYQQGFESLLQIPVLSDVYKHMFLRTLGFTPIHAEMEKTMEYQCDRELLKFWQIPVCSIEEGARMQTRIQELLNQPDLPPVERIILKNVSVNVYLQFTQFQYRKIANSDITNRFKYKKLKALSRFILRHCTELDICVGWLQYATLCYLTGNLFRVISLVEKLLPKFESSTMYSGQSFVNATKSKYGNRMCGRGMTIRQKQQHAVVFTYMCFPSIGFYPPEIAAEIKIHDQETLPFICIPSKLYSYVLLFLVYHKLGISEMRDNILYKLFESVEDKHFVTAFEKPLASSLVQRCVEIANSSV